jgi:hypothetical protein
MSISSWSTSPIVSSYFPFFPPFLEHTLPIFVQLFSVPLFLSFGIGTATYSSQIQSVRLDSYLRPFGFYERTARLFARRNLPVGLRLL